MRPSDGGGSGSRILIDPVSLTASAGRVKAAVAELRLASSSLSRLALPDMPAGVAGTVQHALDAATGSLNGDPQLLDSAVVELTRRAFLAEYADQMMGGYTLTGVARNEFVAWMKDGTLLQYADDDQGEAAGRQLAQLYKNFRDDPQQLIDLAGCLKGAEQWGNRDVENAFGAGFVNQFGAKNMELVPRVIQALEWSRAISGQMSLDPHVLADVAARWQGNDLHQNPVSDLLAPFSIALANATTSGLLTRTTEDAIAKDSDTWATAALVSSGTFSTQFLLKVFKSGVVDTIAQNSMYHGGGAMGTEPSAAPYTLGGMWSDGKDALPYDSKQIVLDALARNPEAAQLALTTPLDGVQAWDRYGERGTVSDPLDLLYSYGHFDDHGSAFGHAYAAAADSLNSDPSDLASRGDGAQLTQHALKLMLGDSGDGQNGFKDGVAQDLARNHIGDLFTSAVALDNSGPGVVDVHDGTQVLLSQDALTDTLKRLGDEPSALQTLLHSGSIYQGALIHQGTGEPAGSSTEWAYKAAAFDAHVLNSADLSRLDHFNADDERHQVVVGFFKDAINDAIAVDNPLASAIVHGGVSSAIDSAFPGPDVSHVITDNSDAKALMTNSLHASIVGSYYEHGQLSADALPPASIMPDGQLASYGDVHGQARWDYNGWINDNPQVEKVTRQAFAEVSRAYQERAVDLVG
jgi:hypothetical protein